jgi:hypothetical protein
MSSIEAELRDIKLTLREMSEKIDALLEEREVVTFMSLAAQGLEEFLSREPDLYTPKDVKVRY